MEQQIRYCTSADGTRIAYATYGELSETPVVLVDIWASHQDARWKQPGFRSFVEALNQGRGLITYDRRGTGASQRDVADISLEAQEADLSAVVDRAGLHRFDILGSYEGAAISALYAARNEERVSHLALLTPFVYGRQMASPEAMQAIQDLIRANWALARRALADATFPNGPTEVQRWFSGMLREAISSEMAERYYDQMVTRLDVRSALPRLRAPTLVLWHGDYRGGSGKLVAELIPDARLVTVEEDLAAILQGNHGKLVRLITQFLDEGRHQPQAKLAGTPALQTILFTDLVSSTALTQRLGDAKAQELVRAHNTIVRDALASHGGTEIKHTGDGIMASFPSASGALESAIGIQRAAAGTPNAGAGGGRDPRPSTLDPSSIKIGLNAGEPVAEESDLFGTAVQLARRVCDQASGGEILVSNVVRELAAGKDFLFSDRGVADLKGFDEPVRLFEVRWQDESVGAHGSAPSES